MSVGFWRSPPLTPLFLEKVLLMRAPRIAVDHDEHELVRSNRQGNSYNIVEGHCTAVPDIRIAPGQFGHVRVREGEGKNTASVFKGNHALSTSRMIACQLSRLGVQFPGDMFGSKQPKGHRNRDIRQDGKGWEGYQSNGGWAGSCSFAASDLTVYPLRRCLKNCELGK